jgi:ABC-type sugar transport system permease subunit
MNRREHMMAFLFVAPACALILLFVLWPVVNTFATSLFQVGLTDQHYGPYCGVANYRALFDDPAFRRSAANTAVFTVAVVPVQTVLALLFALWTNSPGWSRRALRVSVFLPTVLSLTVLSVLWRLLYEPASLSGTGLFNGVLAALHLPTQPFLTSPHQAIWAIVIMSVWQGVGLQMMIFLAALQQIPDERYEAARIDGAGGWQRFRHVTLPAIAPTAMFVVMVTTIFALKLFVQPFIMTRGGPEGSTMSVVQYIYEAAFFARDLGLACAAGGVFFVAVCLIAVALRGLMRVVEARQ